MRIGEYQELLLKIQDLGDKMDELLKIKAKSKVPAKAKAKPKAPANGSREGNFAACEQIDHS